MSPISMRNVRTGDFLAWCLSFCFAGLAMTAVAQSQSPGQNPESSGTVVIPPDVQAKPQPQPGVQPPPPADLWDRWKIQKVSNDDDWTRHFRIGAMVGLNISANFSMKGQFNIPGNNAANGIYDDGHVIPDPSNTQDDYTWNWGYNNASQVSGSSLIMHQSTSFSSDSGSSATKEEGSAFVGFDMTYGGNLFYVGRARIGWDLGFGLLPINIKSSQSLSGTVSRDAFSFETGGINMLGEPPGYQGGPTGASIHGARTPLSGDTVHGTVVGTQTLDVMLYTVRLGPSVYWDLNQYFGLSVGVGPAVGIVSGDYKYDEIVSSGGGSARNQGRFGTTDLVYGGYVNATVIYHVPGENADIYVGGQYMPMGDATFSSGGREARLNLGGQVYISAGINWAF